MNKVYFKAVDSIDKTEEIVKASKILLEELTKNEEVELNSYIPLKVHFGEKGNKTYIQSKNFAGIRDFLNSKDIKSAYIETNVLYKGQRTTRENHINLAKEHGFTELPIIIADGERGEEYKAVEINKKNFKTVKIGKEIAEAKQLIVVSHFKGHMLAGFGGAIKQLGMGCAARGGKLDQHANSRPNISNLRCKACKACINNCPEKAIALKSFGLGQKAKIDKEKCVGCAACMAICPHNAISNSWRASLSKNFNERLVEYAYGAQLGKKNIYISFAFNITKGCDCEGHAMKPVVKDLGVLASLDPVAIDQASLDLVDKENGRTVFGRGRYTLEYGEQIGLGSRKYELITL